MGEHRQSYPHDTHADRTPAPDELSGTIESAIDDPDPLVFLSLVSTIVSAVDPRTKIAQAIEAGDQLIPPLESETWPACRPLIEWMIGLLPAGGIGYASPEVTTAEMSQLAQRFLRSPQAAAR